MFKSIYFRIQHILRLFQYFKIFPVHKFTDHAPAKPETETRNPKSRNRRNRKKLADPAQQAKRSTPTPKVDVHVYPGLKWRFWNDAFLNDAFEMTFLKRRFWNDVFEMTLLKWRFWNDDFEMTILKWRFWNNVFEMTFLKWRFLNDAFWNDFLGSKWPFNTIIWSNVLGLKWHFCNNVFEVTF